MEARLANKMLARVSSDSRARSSDSTAGSRKRRIGDQHVEKAKKNQNKKKKKQKKKKGQQAANLLDLAARELQRRDMTQRNVKVLTTRRDLSGSSQALLKSLLPVHATKLTGGGDTADSGKSEADDIFDF
eukprot:g4960.t1